MSFDEFRSSLSIASPPLSLSLPLQALWHTGKGNWEAAHAIAQEINTETGSWIHAHLHRKEGDDGNAAYWYRRANKPVPKNSLDEEWEQIAKALLNL